MDITMTNHLVPQKDSSTNPHNLYSNPSVQTVKHRFKSPHMYFFNMNNILLSPTHKSKSVS